MTAEDGWVEWLNQKVENAGRRIHRMRLVHCNPASSLPGPNGCQFDANEEYVQGNGGVADSELGRFLGPDGLTRLLEKLQPGAALDEIVEMIKRLHTPGYEQARLHFDTAQSAGVFESDLRQGFYLQEQIQRTLAYAEQRSKDEEL